MEQTATLPRKTLLNVFLNALTDKVNQLNANIISKKIKKKIIVEIYAYVNNTIHSNDKPILLPTQFRIKPTSICGADIGFIFNWERPSTNEDGEFKLICGGQTTLKKYKKMWLETTDCFRLFCDEWNDIKPYLCDKPTIGKRLTLMRNLNDQTIYESENCPVCLDEWSVVDDGAKKTAKCGHSCCWTCMKILVMSQQPLCPVCRTDYKKNETFKYIEDPSVMNDWYRDTKTGFKMGLKLWELETKQPYIFNMNRNKMRLLWLKTYIDIPIFKKTLIEKYDFGIFIDKMVVLGKIENKYNGELGEDFYIFNQSTKNIN